MILKRFVVLEGIDGCGTTTQINKLVSFCEKKLIKVFKTCEPTSSSIGCLIDDFLKGQTSFAPNTIARLFACDRAEHIYGKNGIIDALAGGALVFCDRYLFSSLAYQGFGDLRKLVKKENEDFPLPEVLFLFQISAQKAMSRIKERKGEKEIYEKRQFLDQVSKNYLYIMEEYQQNEKEMKIILVDAEKAEEEVFSFILKQLQDMGML